MLFLLNSLFMAIGFTVNLYFFASATMAKQAIFLQGYFMWHGLKCLLLTSFDTAIVLF